MELPSEICEGLEKLSRNELQTNAKRLIRYKKNISLGTGHRTQSSISHSLLTSNVLNRKQNQPLQVVNKKLQANDQIKVAEYSSRSSGGQKTLTLGWSIVLKIGFSCQPHRHTDGFFAFTTDNPP